MNTKENCVIKKSFQIFLFFIILVLAFLVRIYKIDSPLADWHSWRQADTASVALEFTQHNYSIIKPHYHDLSNIPSGLDNLEGYRMVEFPLINYLVAKIVLFNSNFNLVIVYRLVNIVLALFGLVAIFYFVKFYTQNLLLSFLSLIFMAFLPYNIFYSRTILPDPAMLAFQLLSLVLLTKFYQQKKLHDQLFLSKNTFFFWLFLSCLCLAVSLLIKPVSVFILPVFILIVLQNEKIMLKTIFFWLIILSLILLPLIWWRQYIKNYPAGIPASDWLLNGNGIRLKLAWWRWLFWERIVKLMLGFWGSLVILIGLMRVKLKNIIKSKFSQILVIWSLSAFSYLIIFATGNVQHDYYQVLIIPILSLLLAYFTFQLWSTSRLILVKKNWLHVFLSVMSLNLFLIYYLKFIDFAKTQQHSFGELKSLVIIFLFLFLGIKMKKSRKVPNLIFFSMIFGLIINFYFCWQRVKGYYNINNPAIVSAGQKATQILPIEAKIIAPYQGDTAFLWQTQRTGWPIGFDIEGKIAKGATHYITVNYDDEARELATKYQTIIQEEDYLILDLTKKLE